MTQKHFMSQIKALLKKLADTSHKKKSYLQLQFDFIARNVHKTRKKIEFSQKKCVAEKKNKKKRKCFYASSQTFFKFQ